MPSLSVNSVRLIDLYGKKQDEPGTIYLVLDIQKEPAEGYNYVQHRTVWVEDPATYIEMWNGGPADRNLVKLWLEEELIRARHSGSNFKKNLI